MPLSSINIYTLKQIRTKRHRYDLEDYPITSPLTCYKVLQFLLDLNSEPGRVELQYATLKKRTYALLKFGIISLNTRNKIVGIHIIGTGSLDQLYIEPREVIMAAMMNNAKAIIAFHNHPSGDPEPSRDDIFLTRRLKEAGKIMCIELLEHLITGEWNYYSLREKGFI
ncbi:MAG TPA: DNA repair protein RadC [Firmicutes bacterium]|jgi:DNA repair protein RadC|nr:DNA repair protein RadC [Bacillota bacterium]